MRADEISVGQVIDYRGSPATVIRAWKNGEGAAKGITEPVGVEIEWECADIPGIVQRTRLVWPELTAGERLANKRGDWIDPETGEVSSLSDEEFDALYAARLESELNNRLLRAWS